MAKQHFCNRCGIYTFHETLCTPGSYQVNLGCIDDIDAAQLAVEVFDGRILL